MESLIIALPNRSLVTNLRHAAERVGVITNSSSPDAFVIDGAADAEHVVVTPEENTIRADWPDDEWARLEAAIGETVNNESIVLVSVAYRDVPYVKAFLREALVGVPGAIDTNFGLIESNAAFLTRLERDPGWDWTESCDDDPPADAGVAPGG